MEKKETITKEHIAEAIFKKIGLPITEGTKLFEDFIDIISIGLRQKGYFKIMGFGSFKVNTKKERIGVNPKTREEIVIKARNNIQFIPSTSLKKQINNNV